MIIYDVVCGNLTLHIDRICSPNPAGVTLIKAGMTTVHDHGRQEYDSKSKEDVQVLQVTRWLLRHLVILQ
jgi:hypothetical protein